MLSFIALAVLLGPHAALAAKCTLDSKCPPDSPCCSRTSSNFLEIVTSYMRYKTQQLT